MYACAFMFLSAMWIILTRARLCVSMWWWYQRMQYYHHSSGLLAFDYISAFVLVYTHGKNNDPKCEKCISKEETVLLLLSFFFFSYGCVVVVVWIRSYPNGNASLIFVIPFFYVDILCYIRWCRIHERIEYNIYLTTYLGTQANFVSDTVCIREYVMTGVNLKTQEEEEESKKKNQTGRLFCMQFCLFRWFLIVIGRVKNCHCRRSNWTVLEVKNVTSRQQVYSICAVFMRIMRRHSAIIDIVVYVWVHEKRRRKKKKPHTPESTIHRVSHLTA